MVAPAAPAPFLLPPDRVEAFITALGDPALTIENIADDFHTTVGGLCLFRISPEGPALVSNALSSRIAIENAAGFPAALLQDGMASRSEID